MGKRAQRRRRGQRIEAEKLAARILMAEQRKVWNKIAGTNTAPRYSFEFDYDTRSIAVIRTFSDTYE